MNSLGLSFISERLRKPVFPGDQISVEIGARGFTVHWTKLPFPPGFCELLLDECFPSLAYGKISVARSSTLFVIQPGPTMKSLHILFVSAMLSLGGCASAYYDTMEKVGVHKRDILVDRVELAQEAQTEAQDQFKSALDQFASVVQLQETDLRKAYERLNDEYEESESSAAEVTNRIEKVESVATALFDEWREELNLYDNRSLKAASTRKLRHTEQRYGEMLASMKRAESSMQPVLTALRDNVLFLKHNLNAQAVGTLRGEFSSLKADISQLIERMNSSISRSNQFIQELQSST